MRIDRALVVAVVMTGCSPDDGAARVEAPALSKAGPQLLAPRDPAGSVVDVARMQGRWRVIGVALAESKVQAFVPDDPAYMGQTMIVAGKALAWAPAPAGKAIGATLDDRCTGAATQRLTGAAAAGVTAALTTALGKLGVGRPDPHEIACLEGGNWGGSDGGALLFPIDARTLVMRWYDNVVLKLRWQGA